MIVREDIQEVRRAVLAVIVVGMVFWVMAHILGRDIPATNRDAVMVVLGVLLQRFTDIIGFDFNSSASSAKKDSIIATQAETAKTIASTVATNTAPGDTIVLHPGEQATATATDMGTVIKPKGDKA